jgi:hypothetical protein
MFRNLIPPKKKENWKVVKRLGSSCQQIENVMKAIGQDQIKGEIRVRNGEKLTAPLQLFRATSKWVSEVKVSTDENTILRLIINIFKRR